VGHEVIEMTDTSSRDPEAAAAAYEELHVPALFQAWVDRVLDLAEVSFGDRVLDVACGTGVLARAAARRVGAKGSVVGLDPDAGMLAVAKRLAPSVDWRQGAAEDLPAPDGSFDVVVSQFGMMFFTDPAEAIREMARVLIPGGRLAVAVWDALERSPAYSREVALLERLAGDRAAAALRAPFALGDGRELEDMFRAAGFESTRLVTETRPARFPSVRAMVEADLRGWLPIMGVTLTEEEIAGILSAAEEELASFVQPDGEVVFEASAHIVAGERVS
jgi:ubiquinone/menaquinone biosynthesis C-methylase UbiE